MKNNRRERNVETQIKNIDLVRMRHLQISKGATKLFVKKGYFKTTIREISKATGITIGNLYDYVTRKEDILYLVFDIFHSMWVKQLDEDGILEIDNPIEQLKIALQRMVEIIHDHREMVLLMYTEGKLLPKEFLRKILGNEKDLIGFFERILKRGVEKGLFRTLDPFLSANIIVYLLSLEPLRGWNLRERYSVDEIKKFTLDFILQRILVEPDRERGAV